MTNKFNVGNWVVATDRDGKSRVGKVIRVVEIINNVAYKVEFGDGHSSGYPGSSLHRAVLYEAGINSCRDVEINITTGLHSYTPSKYPFRELIDGLNDCSIPGIKES